MDEEYVKERDKLIPHAERYADKVAGPRPWINRDKWERVRDKAFHTEMDRLAKATGLTTGGTNGKS